MSAVTGLQVITNLYSSEIQFTNTESSGNNRNIGSEDTQTVGNAWIPWCDSADQFSAHHMQIQSNNLILYIWQSGPNIHCSSDGWSANAPNIQGNSNISQSVAWILDTNGQLTQTSYS